MNLAVRLNDSGEPVGLNTWAARPVLTLLVMARESLAQWRTEPECDFPFGPVLDYYRAVGRNAADVTLTRRLRECLTPAAVSAYDWLPAWVHMATDAGTGTYDSYLGTALLQRSDLGGRQQPEDRHPADRATPAADTLIVALLADLALVEARQLAACPTNCTFCTRRVRATVNALRRAEEFAPLAINLLAPAEAADLDADDVAAAVIQRTPAALVRLTDICLLPTTVVHDEIMFIRSVQMLELLYRQVARELTAADRAVDIGEHDEALGRIAGCTRRVQGTATLYRIVTTISIAGFDVIREATDGRSAVQSRAFRDVERLCGRCLPEALQSAPATRQAAVLAACEELELAWCAMKKSHWGIARKVIGDVPGTGGTSGASYLRSRADQPLFDREAVREVAA